MREADSSWLTQSSAASPPSTAGRIFIRSCAQESRSIPAVLAIYVGVYELTPTLSIAITLENGQLMEQASPWVVSRRSSYRFRRSAGGFETCLVSTNGTVPAAQLLPGGIGVRLDSLALGVRQGRCAEDLPARLEALVLTADPVGIDGVFVEQTVLVDPVFRDEGVVGTLDQDAALR
jgi:hypothetical protein